jgi:hypothetical protein
MTRVPGSTCSVTKGCSEAADPSARIAIRARPYPRGSLTSTATPTKAFLALGASGPATRVPRRRCRSRPPQRCRSTGPGPDAPRPSAADAASPTRSGKSRSPATAADSTRTSRPSARRTSSRPEPHGQRRPAAVEHGPRRDRRPATTGRTPVSTVGEGPPADVPAPRTHESVRPAQPVQVVQAVGIGTEPRPELPGRPRIVHASARMQRVHNAMLVRSDEYPR